MIVFWDTSVHPFFLLPFILSLFLPFIWIYSPILRLSLSFSFSLLSTFSIQTDRPKIYDRGAPLCRGDGSPEEQRAMPPRLIFDRPSIGEI